MTTAVEVADGHATAPAVPVRRRRSRFTRHLPAYLAISPFYLIFAAFWAFPVGFSAYLSLHSWDGIGAMRYVGLGQFRYLVSDANFWQAVLNTLEIWVISTVPMLCLALVIAFLLNSSVRFRGFYRVAYFIPNVTSLVAIAIIFGSVFSTNYGLMNVVLRSLGLGQVAWLTSPLGLKVTIAAMVVWRWTGYNAIIYLAGLQTIPTELYEAARVDGANQVQIFFRIVLPMLRPIILFTVITSTIGGLQLFTEPQVLYSDNTGGPGGAGMTAVLYLYQQSFVKNDFGYGAAIGWGVFLLIVLFSIINWRLFRRSAR
jgi:cellobiose transport system permease protein